MRSRRKPLAAIVAITLVSVTTLGLVLYSLVNYDTFAKQRRQDLDALMRLHIQELSVALALPVWNFDRAGIDRVMTAMAKPLSIYAISVTASGETHGVRRDANWNLVPWDGKNEPKDMLVTEAPILLSGNRLGIARLICTTRFLEEGLRNERIRIITSIAIFDVLLILCIYFLLYRMVVLPLVEIERYAVTVTAGGQGPPKQLPPGTASELVNLRRSLQSMIALLDRRYIELQEEVIRRFESEERFRAIFDSVNDAIFIHDIDTGAILAVNARMCEMFGYARDEAVRLDIGSLSSGVEPYTGERGVELVRTLRSGNPQLFDWQCRHRDGHLFWVEMNLRIATIGGVQRVLAVARDITQRREMEEALRRSEQMSMMGSLVAGVAHEVRNPLFGIAATIDAFEAEFGNRDGAEEYMTTLRNDVARLSRLMHDLLEYGRPQQVVRHVQSIEPVIAETIRICMPRAKERQIDLEPSVESPLPFVAIDADRMLVVLKNVVENAVELSHAGDAVAIRARAQHNGTSNVVFTIHDRGPGFRPEDLPHIFEPFFTRRKGGNGLGLAIVQKIVTEHGGTIVASNGMNGGATIEIRLPARELR